MKKHNRNFYFLFIGLLALAAFVGCNSTTGNNTKTNAASKNSNSVDYAAIYAKGAPGATPAHSLGSPNALVTIEEFADYQCPTCGLMYPKVNEIRAAYGDRIRIIFRNFPLNIPAHDKAYDAAVAAEAAGLQDESKFGAMQNLLFTNQTTWTTSSDFRKVLDDYAQKIGLDVEKFKNDAAGIEAKTRVDKDLERGRSLNINSTPTFYINGKPVSSADLNFEGMKRLIDAELQKTAGANQATATAPINSNTAIVTNNSTNAAAGNSNSTNK